MSKETAKESKKSIGQISTELMHKDPGNHTYADQGKDMLKDYVPKLIKAVEEGKKAIPNQSFYVVMLTKHERILHKVIRIYPRVRMSCPTPSYDQAVYYYDHFKQDLEFLWVVPDRKTCLHLMANALNLPVEERCLLDLVMQFEQGKLDALARKRNGELVNQVNPIIKINT